MISFNKVILMGNLTRDPEIRYTPNGTPVGTFRLAVNRRYRHGDDLKEEVCYVDIVVFGKQAESCGQYLNKGSGVIVEGRLQERRWESEDGQRRSRHEVVAQMVRFLPKRQEFSSVEGRNPVGATDSVSEADWPGGEEVVDQDVPF